MRKELVRVVINPPREYIELSKTNPKVPTFAFSGKKPVGMLVYKEGRGWITYRGGGRMYIPVTTREECIRIGIESYGFEYYTERP